MFKNAVTYHKNTILYLILQKQRKIQDEKNKHRKHVVLKHVCITCCETREKSLNMFKIASKTRQIASTFKIRLNVQVNTAL